MTIDKNWHLDKRLTVVNIITIVGVVIVGASAWFSLVNQGTAQSKDIKTIQVQNEKQETKIDDNTTNVWVISKDVAVMKNTVGNIERNQTTINNKLDTLLLRNHGTGRDR